jgi:hypothetical protein
MQMTADDEAMKSDYQPEGKNTALSSCVYLFSTEIKP